jgi:hypothetical protein
MAKQKNKPAKKVKKALRKVAKKGPFAAALAIIAGEVLATAKRVRLDRRIVDVAQRAKDRLRRDGEPELATA